MKVVLIPCATTEWRDSGRLLGRVEVPLTDEGRTLCSSWAEAFRGAGLSGIFHSSDELASQTAHLIAKPLELRTKRLADLDEVDVGLWTGLTEEQLKSRYTGAHKQLCESPMSVAPPDGESFSDAAKRVTACLKKKIRREGKPAIAVVMRPLALAMARCELESRPVSEFWSGWRDQNGPIVVDCSAKPAESTTVVGH